MVEYKSFIEYYTHLTITFLDHKDLISHRLNNQESVDISFALFSRFLLSAMLLQPLIESRKKKKKSRSFNTKNSNHKSAEFALMNSPAG